MLTFLERGYHRVPFKTGNTIPTVVEGVRQILQFKQGAALTPWLRDKKTQKRDTGLTIRRGKGKDCKAYFQFRPELRAILCTRGVVLTPAEDQWITACERLHEKCRRQVARLISFLEKNPRLKKWGLLPRLQKMAEDHVLRILIYTPVQGGKEVMAQAHSDKSGFTLQLEEAWPGYIAIRNGGRKMLEGLKNHALFFPGDKAEVATAMEICALVHEVIERRTDVKRERPGRWSVVFFAHLSLSKREFNLFERLHETRMQMLKAA